MLRIIARVRYDRDTFHHGPRMTIAIEYNQDFAFLAGKQRILREPGSRAPAARSDIHQQKRFIPCIAEFINKPDAIPLPDRTEIPDRILPFDRRIIGCIQ